MYDQAFLGRNSHKSATRKVKLLFVAGQIRLSLSLPASLVHHSSIRNVYTDTEELKSCIPSGSCQTFCKLQIRNRLYVDHMIYSENGKNRNPILTLQLRHDLLHSHQDTLRLKISQSEQRMRYYLYVMENRTSSRAGQCSSITSTGEYRLAVGSRG